MFEIIGCTVNDRFNPLGVDEDRIVFRWKTGSDKENTFTSDVRIGVASTREAAAASLYDIWEGSGELGSCVYGGGLTPCTSYWWRVTAVDNHGETVQSDVCRFETGLRERVVPAEFITAPAGFLMENWLKENMPEDKRGGGEEQGCWLYVNDLTRWYYRRNFEVCLEMTECAELTVDYPFAFEAWINGIQLSAESGHAADITKLCAGGTNRLAIRTHLSDTPFRFLPALRAQIQLYGKDGSIRRILSDRKFRVFNYQDFYSDSEEDGWQVSDKFGRQAVFEVMENHPAALKRSLLIHRDLELHAGIKKARAYVTARGMYELRINGKKAGDGRLTPGVVPAHCSEPHVTSNVLYYQVYDITELLRKGGNAVGALTGSGWYASQGYNTCRAYRNEFWALIWVELEDGTVLEIPTDASWQVSPSPIYENDLQWGERYDARMEKPGWDEYGADMMGWVCAEPVEGIKYQMKAQPFEQVRLTETLAPIEVQRCSEFIRYDFGRNIAGRALLKLKDTVRGQGIAVRYGERIDENGVLIGGPYHDVFYASDTHRDGIAGWGARNVDAYICRGGAWEMYEPRFAYTGFRYVELYGYGRADEDAVSARVFHTDLNPAGEFECSVPLLNGIYAMVKNSFEGNLHYGPTDCPTREKNFWDGDAAVFIPSALWLKDSAAFWREWTRDGRKVRPDAFAWLDEDYIVPWNLYLFYGDTHVLEENYDRIRGGAEVRLAYVKEAVYDNPGVGFNGDHAPPAGCCNMDRRLFDNVFCYHHLDILSRVARITGREEECRRYASLLPGMAKEIKQKLYEPLIGGESRLNFGTYLLPVAFGILKDKDAEKAVRLLDEAVRKNGFRLNTGAVSTPYLLPVLCQYGYTETAWKVAVQTEAPSWGHMFLSGSTATTELWEGESSPAEGNSQNHYFKGTVVEWLYRNLAGIRCGESHAGFERVCFQADIPEKLDWVNASYEGPYGRIISCWKQAEGRLEWTVHLPPDTCGSINAPAGWLFDHTPKRCVRLDSGRRCFTFHKA